VKFDGESLEKLSQISQIHEDSQVIRSGQKDAISNQAISKPKQLIVISDEDDAGDVGVITQEFEIMDTQDFEDMESFLAKDITDVIEQQTWVSSSRKKSKKKTGGRVTIATTASSRVPKDGRSMLEKATQWAQTKNDTSKGISDSNQLLVLNNLSNEYIQDIATSLDLDIVNIDTQIEVFRAKEKVRAALAEANYKEYLAVANSKTAPQGEEAIQEYSLSVMDNTARGFVAQSSTGTGTVIPRKRGRPKKSSKLDSSSGMLGGWVRVVGKNRFECLLKNITCKW
jgi:hypothetical protein